MQLSRKKSKGFQNWHGKIVKNLLKALLGLGLYEIKYDVQSPKGFGEKFLLNNVFKPVKEKDLRSYTKKGIANSLLDNECSTND